MASRAWEQRNARARELGYESYYDYRAHGYGARPPAEPRASGDELARLRGHRGRADLERDVERGRVAYVAPIEGPRDAKGRFKWVLVDVTYTDGTRRQFRLRGNALSPEGADRLRRRLSAAGVDYRPSYVLSRRWAVGRAA